MKKIIRLSSIYAKLTSLFPTLGFSAITILFIVKFNNLLLPIIFFMFISLASLYILLLESIPSIKIENGKITFLVIKRLLIRKYVVNLSDVIDIELSKELNEGNIITVTTKTGDIKFYGYITFRISPGVDKNSYKVVEKLQNIINENDN